jgi:hypothetical protein
MEEMTRQGLAIFTNNTERYFAESKGSHFILFAPKPTNVIPNTLKIFAKINIMTTAPSVLASLVSDALFCRRKYFPAAADANFVNRFMLSIEYGRIRIKSRESIYSPKPDG